MSIHGATHPVTLVARVERDGADITASSSLTVPYVAWGLEDPSVFVLRVAKEVEVQVKLTPSNIKHLDAIRAELEKMNKGGLTRDELIRVAITLLSAEDF